MALKTREKLIEVARQLFIRKGVENTTISDIATASDKGRRTIYTYFKNKKEIYRAVVERESDNMVSELREITFSESKASDKLRQFFEKKLSQRTPSPHSSTLKSLITFDGRRSDMVRKKTYEKEEALLFYILDEGVESGDFDPENCSLLRNFVLRILQSIDLMTLHDESLIDATKIHSFIEFISRGVEKK